jgi:hypothetical protein
MTKIYTVKELYAELMDNGTSYIAGRAGHPYAPGQSRKDWKRGHDEFVKAERKVQ